MSLPNRLSSPTRGSSPALSSVRAPSSPPAGGHRARAAAAVVAASTLALVGWTGVAHASVLDAATGSPVKIGVIAPLKTASIDSSESVSSADAAARALNAGGGIAGHKVVIDACNDQDTVTGASACGRQMINDHVLAVTGSSIYDSAYQPLLASAGIPIVGQEASTINSYTGSNEYLMTAGTIFELYGATYYAATHGEKKIYVSRIDVPATAALSQSIEAAAKKANYAYAGDQAIPETVTDLAPYAQQFKSSGADAAVLGYPIQLALQFTSAIQSIGLTTQKLLYTAGDLASSDISQLGAAGSQYLIGAGLPPLSATNIPGVRLFIKQMAAEHAAGDSDAATGLQSETSLQAWLAVQAVAMIAPKSGALTPATLTTALKGAKKVDLMGLIPSWTPAAPGAAPYTRVSNPDIYIEKIKGGKLVLAQPKPVNVVTGLGL